MNENALTCTLCGGTDFTKEAGYYYCNECQTQSQEIQEHVFQNDAEDEQPTTSKRTHTKRIRTKKKEEDQLTSWECYNYIILGLVNELIEIGANETLKETMRILWMKYLCKLEVLSDNVDATPKLGACNSKIDAEIVYGKQDRKKRLRSRTPSPSTSDGSVSLKKQQSKSKRSFILAEYDEFSNQLKSEDTLLLNQSLVSLGGTSETSSERQHRLLYNKSARKELLKYMSKNHLKNHCKDLNSSLDCHNLSYRSLTEKYLKGPEILTRKRIYALIYLGLLINKDNIQLGDMLRFIREGSLSYHNVSHFFPEDYENRNLNIKSWTLNSSLLSHSGVRVSAAKIAKFIGVVSYISRPNLIELCKRYSKELNLPDEIWGFTINLMTRVPPRMHFTTNSNAIPNYEGRVLSMILFTFKLMFGLDGSTEEYFSTYAENINALNLEKMFVWREWAHYITYRQLVLIQHHFGTQHLYDNDNIQHSTSFINFITEQNMKYDNDTGDTNHIAEVLKGLLEKLKDKNNEQNNAISFTPSLTPFRQYVKTLLNTNIPVERNYLIDVLSSSFEKDSLSCIRNPYVYLNRLYTNKRIGIKHRGVNKNIRFCKIQNLKLEREHWRSNAKRNVLINIGKNTNLTITDNKEVCNELDTKIRLKHFVLENMLSYKRSMSTLARSYYKNKQKLQIDESCGTESHTYNGVMEFVKESLNLSPENKNISGNTHCFYYNPHDRFWLRSQNVSEINKEDFMNFFSKFPESFKLLFSECARISEQDSKEYFEEYTNVEIHICYGTSILNIQNNNDDIELNKLIKKATTRW